MRKSRRAWVVCLAMALVVGVAACGGDGGSPSTTGQSTSTSSPAASTTPTTPTTTDTAHEQLIAAAQAEGTVTVYTHATGIEEALAPAFLEEYGIELEFLLEGADLLTRLDAELEGDALQADVVITSTVDWLVRHEADLIDLNGIGPGSAELAATEFFHDTYAFVYFFPMVIGYNTDLVPDGITGYADLADPSLKGRIGAIDPVVATHFAFLDWLDTEGYPGFFNVLGDQDAQLYAAVAPMAAAVGAGEISAAIAMTAAAVNTTKAVGAPIEFVVPAEGAFSIGSALATFTDAPHPNAAKLFSDWLMSPAGLDALNAPNPFTNPLGGESGVDLGDAPLTLYDPLDWLDTAKIDEVRTRFDAAVR